jgi:hypothetical protein
MTDDDARVTRFGQVEGVKFGVLDMNLPNVGWAGTTYYGVAHIPMVMAKQPGRLPLLRAPELHGDGVSALVDFAKAQLAKLALPAVRRAAAASRLPVPAVDPDFVYKITYPDSGLANDVRTNQAWAGAALPPAPYAESDADANVEGFDEAEL